MVQSKTYIKRFSHLGFKSRKHYTDSSFKEKQNKALTPTLGIQTEASAGFLHHS